MKELWILFILAAIPFIPWKRVYLFLWDRFSIIMPSPVEEFDVLLRKKWPMIRAQHLFMFSFLLILIAVFFFLVGTFLNLPTISLPMGVMGGFIAPFLAIYILKPNIEASFLFEVRLCYTQLKTQIAAGASPTEALTLITSWSNTLKKDLQEILLVWGGNIDETLHTIANKYQTDELNIFLSLIKEMHHAGSTDQKEVMQSFDRMKEMMEDEITAKEHMSDEKEMELLEISSTAYIIALIFFMVLPVIGDMIQQFNNLN